MGINEQDWDYVIDCVMEIWIYGQDWDYVLEMRIYGQDWDYVMEMRFIDKTEFT